MTKTLSIALIFALAGTAHAGPTWFEKFTGGLTRLSDGFLKHGLPESRPALAVLKTLQTVQEEQEAMPKEERDLFLFHEIDWVKSMTPFFYTDSEVSWKDLLYVDQLLKGNAPYTFLVRGLSSPISKEQKIQLIEILLNRYLDQQGFYSDFSVNDRTTRTDRQATLRDYWEAWLKSADLKSDGLPEGLKKKYDSELPRETAETEARRKILRSNTETLDAKLEAIVFLDEAGVFQESDALFAVEVLRPHIPSALQRLLKNLRDRFVDDDYVFSRDWSNAVAAVVNRVTDPKKVKDFVLANIDAASTAGLSGYIANGGTLDERYQAKVVSLARKLNNIYHRSRDLQFIAAIARPADKVFIQFIRERLVVDEKNSFFPLLILDLAARTLVQLNDRSPETIVALRKVLQRQVDLGFFPAVTLWALVKLGYSDEQTDKLLAAIQMSPHTQTDRLFGSISSSNIFKATEALVESGTILPREMIENLWNVRGTPIDRPAADAYIWSLAHLLNGIHREDIHNLCRQKLLPQAPKALPAPEVP